MSVNGMMPRLLANSIPAELRALPQWVGWRYEVRRGKRTKIPINPKNGKPASSTDPTTWGTFDAVWVKLELFQYARHGWEGMGFVFTADDPFYGIDLDACRNRETGELTPWAAEIIRTIDSYAEVSPSGTGVKIVARAKLPDGKGCAKKLKDVPTFGDKAPEVAIYDRARFWCLTGQRLQSAPLSCESRQQQLDALLARYFTPKSAANGKPRRNGMAGGAWFDQLLSDCATAENGTRSERDFALCAAAVRHGCDRGEVWRRVANVGKFAEAGERYFNLTWKKAEDAGEKSRVPAADDADAEFSPITNGIETGGDGDADGELVPLPMAEVLRIINGTTDQWPRRVDQALFVPDGAGSVSWLTTEAAVWGWLSNQTGVIQWHGAKGCCSKGEVCAELRRTAQAYLAIEELPHWPLMLGHFYACPKPQPGDGSTLRGLLDRFEPATAIDRDLLLACILTMFWGGAAGTRPAFVVTADAGRGKGKSKAAELMARVAGGTIDFSANDEIAAVKTRLLSADALTRRVALLDNVKSLRFSWAELEALITAPIISGKRLYVGEGRRPNTLTWIITLNGASLSTDMAQRSVIVKIGEPKRSKTWEDEAKAYVDANRQAIIADAIDTLRKPPTAELERFTRWATWEGAVLSRLPEPSDAQAVILERQGTVDVEAEEADLIGDFFAQQLDRIGYAADRQIVFIPSAVAARWINWATGVKHRDTVPACRALNQLIDQKRLDYLQASPSRAYGRGFIWIGEHADAEAEVHRDIQERLARLQGN